MHRMGAHIHKDNPPWSKVLRHARLLCESKREQCIEPIEEGSRRKRRLDPAAKRRGGEKAAITLWPSWLEREPVATHQEKHQEQTDQVRQE